MGLLDIVFPKNCVSCGHAGGYMCHKCIARVDFATTICPSCRRFSFYGKTHAQCTSNETLTGLVLLWNYEGVIRHAITTLKYRFALQIATELGKASAVEIKKFRLPKGSAFVPIPLHGRRSKWRGFNQAEELSMIIGRELKRDVYPDLLIRTHDSVPQVKLPTQKRLRNISGKIAVNKALLCKIDVKTPLVIVDDVWTTGSTIKEAGKVLRLAGFENVWGLAIATKK